MSGICNMDCIEMMSKMDDKSVDFVFTDPPYNVGKNYEVYQDNLNEQEYFNWMKRVVEQSKRISKNGIAFFVGSKRIRMFWDLIPDARLIIVRKGAIATPTSDNYYRQWSGLLVNKKPIERCYDIWDDIRMPGEGYYFREERFSHPGLTAQRLVARVLRFFTREHEIIFDPFMGVGTTAVVCQEYNRQWCGSEINPRYVQIANERLKINQSQERMNFSTGTNER